jgi:hypothetical protein
VLRRHIRWPGLPPEPLGKQRLDLGSHAFGDHREELVLLAGWQRRHPVRDPAIADRRQRGAGLRGGGDQVIIDLQESPDTGQRVTQILQPRRDRRLGIVFQVLALIFVEPAQLDGEQPPQLEQPRISGGQLVAGREQRVE